MNNTLRPLARAAVKNLRAPVIVRPTSMTTPRLVQRRAFGSSESGCKPNLTKHKTSLVEKILVGAMATAAVSTIGWAGAITYEIHCDIRHLLRERGEDDRLFKNLGALKDKIVGKAVRQDTVESLREKLHGAEARLVDANAALKDAQDGMGFMEALLDNQETIRQNQAKLLAWVESLLEREEKSRRVTVALENRIGSLESQIEDLKAHNASGEKVTGLESRVQELGGLGSKVEEMQAQLNETSCAVKEDMDDMVWRAVMASCFAAVVVQILPLFPMVPWL